MASGASLKNGDAVRARIAKWKKKIPDALGAALYKETQIEATEAKKRTPVDRGPLRASVHAEGPFRRGTMIWTQIVAGGPAAPYAVYVHEDLEAFHKVGQAKFIESVIMESRPYMAARVAKRMQLAELNK